MTLEQLRIFVAVAERQHVTRAAEALNLTQSAASSAIHALEESFQVKLFHRVGRGIELSDAGHLFLDEARGVLARADVARLHLAELGGLRRGTLRLHASQTIASYWLPRHLMSFRRAHPLVDLVVRVGNTAEVALAVRDGIAEIGLVEGTVDHPGLTARELARDQLVVVVAPDHPWAARNTAIAAADLVETDWVMREPGSGTRSEFELALSTAGIDVATLVVALELPSNEAVRAAVEAGGAAAAISASVAAPSIEAGLLVAVPFNLPSRAYRSLMHAERTPSRSATAFLEGLGRPALSRTAPAAAADR